MELRGKAFFNLLKMLWIEDPSIEVEPWQVEDLRGLNIAELFSRLEKLDIILDEESFFLYAEDCSSPEELIELLWQARGGEKNKSKAYLILFELWRVLFPEKLCLSILCDEIDALIDLYDQDLLSNDEPLQRALSFLEDILDDGCDNLGDPQTLFSYVTSFSAHDLESFLFDYISDQILEGNDTYASEILDAFYDYASDSRRFDLLRARLFAMSDVEKSTMIYERVLEEVIEKPDPGLGLLLIENLIHHENVDLLMRAVKAILPMLKIEEELQQLLTLILEYYRCLDLEEKEMTIKELLQARLREPLEKVVDEETRTIIGNVLFE